MREGRGIQRTPHGIWLSLGCFLLMYILWQWPLKPQFVVPTKQRDHTKAMRERIVLRCMGISIVVYPLDIRLHTGVHESQSSAQYVQVLLDISLSMAATDVEPDRFQIAKDTLQDVLKGLSGDIVSLITFSGIPIMIMPFSPHKPAVLERIRNLRLSEFPPTSFFVGTAIGDALLMGVDNLQQIAARQQYPGAIILITDGDSSRGVDPYGLIGMVESTGVPVFGLAIGSTDEMIGKDLDGAVVVAPLHPELLQELAERTGGYFSHVQKGTEVKDFIQHVQKALTAVDAKTRILQTIELNMLLGWILGGGVLFRLRVWSRIGAKNLKRLPE